MALVLGFFFFFFFFENQYEWCLRLCKCTSSHAHHATLRNRVVYEVNQWVSKEICPPKFSTVTGPKNELHENSYWRFYCLLINCNFFIFRSRFPLIVETQLGYLLMEENAKNLFMEIGKYLMQCLMKQRSNNMILLLPFQQFKILMEHNCNVRPVL